ncbi:unnamed protein product [Polarella glacialis]|uniref:Uncharacterized protein n=1 Tax=Polarella glacialis TaxID=89957 RepID=A0A813LWE4_POLGL|nr:unnamed protein product [Polarella glacialis]
MKKQIGLLDLTVYTFSIRRYRKTAHVCLLVFRCPCKMHVGLAPALVLCILPGDLVQWYPAAQLRGSAWSCRCRRYVVVVVVALLVVVAVVVLVVVVVAVAVKCLGICKPALLSRALPTSTTTTPTRTATTTTATTTRTTAAAANYMSPCHSFGISDADKQFQLIQGM